MDLTMLTTLKIRHSILIWLGWTLGCAVGVAISEFVALRVLSAAQSAGSGLGFAAVLISPFGASWRLGALPVPLLLIQTGVLLLVVRRLRTLLWLPLSLCAAAVAALSFPWLMMFAITTVNRLPSVTERGQLGLVLVLVVIFGLIPGVLLGAFQLPALAGRVAPLTWLVSSGVGVLLAVAIEGGLLAQPVTSGGRTVGASIGFSISPDATVDPNHALAAGLYGAVTGLALAGMRRGPGIGLGRDLAGDPSAGAASSGPP
jgi:hypothetical protein